MRSYRAVLAAPQVLRVFGASLLGRLPIGMAGLAVILLVHDVTGSFGTAGLVTGAFAVCTGLAAPVLGRLVDRLGQTRVLLAATAVSAGAIATLALLAGRVGTGVLLGCAAVAGLANPPLPACMRALWPRLLGEGDDVQTAYALESTFQELIFISGPLIVVGLVAVASPRVAVLAVGVLGVAGTAWFASSPASRGWRGSARPAGDWAGPLRSPGLRALLGLLVIVAFAFGQVEVAVPAFAAQAGARAGAGALLALWSLGSMLGGLLYGGRAWLGEASRRLGILLALVACGFAPLALATSVGQLAPLMLLAGVAIAPALACAYLLVDRQAPAGMVTEAFTWVSSSFMAGLAAGNAAGGSIVERAGVHVAFLAAFAGAALAALAGLAAWRRRVLGRPPRPSPPRPEPARPEQAQSEPARPARAVRATADRPAEPRTAPATPGTTRRSKLDGTMYSSES